MGQHMVDTGHDPSLRSQPQPHIDIPDLRHRRKGNHPPQILLFDSAPGPHDHPDDAEHEQHIDHLTLRDHIEPNHPAENLNQQKNVPL